MNHDYKADTIRTRILHPLTPILHPTSNRRISMPHAHLQTKITCDQILSKQYHLLQIGIFDQQVQYEEKTSECGWTAPIYAVHKPDKPTHFCILYEPESPQDSPEDDVSYCTV